MSHLPVSHSEPSRLIAALALAAGLLAGGATTAGAGTARASELDGFFDEHGAAVGEACVEASCGTRCQQILDRARRATAVYLDEAAALERGYQADPHCVSVPNVGGMGFHYVSQERLADRKIDARLPEILVYEEMPNGERLLVALEYFMPVLSNGVPWFGGENEPPPTVDNPPPVLFGRTFDGPMAGHNPGMPWHYDLHVWAWKHNPRGDFTQFNPAVVCR